MVLVFSFFSTLISLSQNPNYLRDIDGNIYKTIKIGNQVWMAENLRVTCYRNGDSIPNITNNKQWSKDTLGAYCNPNNYVKNAADYGRLYNYYAVSDPRGLAPEGWHVATMNDWRHLRSNLSSYEITGLHMQEIDSDYWSKKMQNSGNFIWVKLELLKVSLEEYNKSMDDIISSYQNKYKQEIDSVFWEKLRDDYTHVVEREMQTGIFLDILYSFYNFDTTNFDYQKEKELENELAILKQLKHELFQNLKNKIKIEFLPEAFAEYYYNIDTITFINQKKKVTEIYKMKYDSIYSYHFERMITSIESGFIDSVMKLDTIIPNSVKKAKQRIYVISWKNDKQKSDTIYWNKDVQKYDIMAWYYVKFASNNSGFNALPAGYRASYGEYVWLGQAAYWLVTKSDKPNYVWFHNLCDNCFGTMGHDMFAFKRKSFGYSIRCVKD